MSGRINYFHSVRLEEDKCKGCTHCIRTCPTEAIRVRNGKATIMEERCIDCGECIRTCPNNAKISVTDTFDDLSAFRHTIAAPAPAFVGQFSRKYPLHRVLSGFLDMGFDEVFEVGFGAVLVGREITEYFHGTGAAVPRPLISSACPAVVRLIQVKYPGFVDHILPMQSPMEVTARYARERAAARTGLAPRDIGVFFISPCPAKVTVVKQPIGADTSHVDGALAAKDMVNFIKKNFVSISESPDVQRAAETGILWGRRGGEAAAVNVPRKITVDGIRHVSHLLEIVEAGGLRNINFIEAQACVGGCVGGVLMVENPFMAKLKVDMVAAEVDGRHDEELEEAYRTIPRDHYMLRRRIEPRSIISLDANVDEAMRKLKEIEKVAGGLPGTDCGSCGCPTCRAFAEDVAGGLMPIIDCPFVLRKRVRSLAGEIYDLAKKIPHTEQEKETNHDTGATHS